MQKEYKIRNRAKDVYYNYYRFLMPLLNKICSMLVKDVCFLRNADIKVLGALMYYYNELRYDDKKLFSQVIIEQICEDAGISYYNFNTTLCRLRRFNILLGTMRERKLNPVFVCKLEDIDKEKGLTVKMDFIINKEQ